MLNVFHVSLVCQGFCASKNVSKVVCLYSVFFFNSQWTALLLFPVQKSQKKYLHLKRNQVSVFKRMIYGRKPNSAYNIQMNYTIR